MITAVSASEVDTLPVKELLTRIGAGLGEIKPTFLPGWEHSVFHGILLSTLDGGLVVGVPVGQDPQEREAVIRELVRRQLPAGAE